MKIICGRCINRPAIQKMSDSTPTSDLEPPQNGQAENLKSENVQNVTEIPAEQQENPLFKGSWKPLKSSEITTEAKVEESYNSSNGKGNLTKFSEFF